MDLNLDEQGPQDLSELGRLLLAASRGRLPAPPEGAAARHRLYNVESLEGGRVLLRMASSRPGTGVVLTATQAAYLGNGLLSIANEASRPDPRLAS